jgi:hypothetical protein
VRPSRWRHASDSLPRPTSLSRQLVRVVFRHISSPPSLYKVSGRPSILDAGPQTSSTIQVQGSVFDRINSSNNEFNRFNPFKTFNTFQWFNVRRTEHDEQANRLTTRHVLVYIHPEIFGRRDLRVNEGKLFSTTSISVFSLRPSPERWMPKPWRRHHSSAGSEGCRIHFFPGGGHECQSQKTKPREPAVVGFKRPR